MESTNLAIVISGQNPAALQSLRNALRRVNPYADEIVDRLQAKFEKAIEGRNVNGAKPADSSGYRDPFVDRRVVTQTETYQNDDGVDVDHDLNLRVTLMTERDFRMFYDATEPEIEGHPVHVTTDRFRTYGRWERGERDSLGEGVADVPTRAAGHELLS